MGCNFDYNTITDVIIHLRYTAIDGGDKLKQAATCFVTDYVNGVLELSKDEGLFAVFDLRHDFPNEWYKATHPATGATARVIALDNLVDRLPIFTKGKDVKSTVIHLFVPSTFSILASSLVIQHQVIYL